jgi:transposase
MAKTSKHVQPYSPEFRAEAIRLAHTSGKSHAQIAQDLGMTSETLRLWREARRSERRHAA